jgi:hypothetical protein
MSYEPENRIQPHRPTERLQVGQLLKMVLQDTQTQLVFRSQALIRSDVESYVPQEDDLDYPGKILRGVFRVVLSRALALIHGTRQPPPTSRVVQGNTFCPLTRTTTRTRITLRSLPRRLRRLGILHSGPRCGFCHVCTPMFR